MSCLNEIITNNIVYDCNYKPVAGLESKILIIPKSYIDYSLSTFDTENPLKLTNLVLYSGKKGVLIEGIENTHDAAFEMSENEYGKSYLHKIIGKLLNTDVASRWELTKMLMSDEKYVAVVHRIWKGVDNAEAFQVYGWQYGLTGKVHTYQASGNNGVELFELHSKDNVLENLPARTLLQGDYSSTLAAFENGFEGTTL